MVYLTGLSRYRSAQRRPKDMQIKTTIRYALVLVGGFLAGSRLVDAVDNWREWHE